MSYGAIRGGVDQVSGILVVDKAKGMTSHDVIDVIRKRFGVKKAGHAGTLDPNATGVLVVLIGKATKLSQKLTGEDKKYRAVMKLGERTDSGDSTGKIISGGEVFCFPDQIKKVMQGFVGEIEQIPPMFSAKKVGGKRLYKAARRGEVVERAPIKITIKSLEVISLNMPEVEFDVLCTKGTYIRQLADDIGEKLGCGAHLSELRRISSGEFNVDGSVPAAELEKMSKESFYESVARI
ncbi:MAG: tRNA pseudouridine(55) synthase TruB [Candidatus Omnitrophota bacterium]